MNTSLWKVKINHGGEGPGWLRKQCGLLASWRIYGPCSDYLSAATEPIWAWGMFPGLGLQTLSALAGTRLVCGQRQQGQVHLVNSERVNDYWSRSLEVGSSVGWLHDLQQVLTVEFLTSVGAGPKPWFLRPFLVWLLPSALAVSLPTYPLRFMLPATVNDLFSPEHAML